MNYKNLELLFDIIPPHPGLNIALIEENQDEIVQKLHTFAGEIEAVVHVKALGEREEQKEEFLRVKSFSFEQSKYNNFSIIYDFLFLCVDVSGRDDIELVFKKIYRVLKNAGNLLVFVKKDDKQRYMELLEEINYVALNSIDLNEETEVITAKKMHGWKKV
jgi:hypothetical protein